MKKLIITESERERILNMHKAKGYRQPINEDLLPSDFGHPQPHKAEDLIDVDIYDNNVVLYFKDETNETFELKTKSSFSPGEPSSYDSPGYDDQFEVDIVGVTQTEPTQMNWEPRQFEDYMKSLGCLDQLMDKLHDEDAYESAADKHYSTRYDTEDEMDENFGDKIQ